MFAHVFRRLNRVARNIRPTRGPSGSRPPMMEQLEDRTLYSLLGVAATLDFPVISLAQTGTVRYTSLTGEFKGTGTPIFFSDSPPPVAVPITDATTIRTFETRVLLGPTGAFVSGVTGDDLIVTGDIDIDGDSVIDYSGVLLTGEAIAFGSQDSGATDNYDLLFVPTGGTLLPYFAGKNIGVALTSERSTFNNSFTEDFGGNLKGTTGQVQPATIGDFVWDDLNANGKQDAGEPGIEGVTVELLNPSLNVVGTTTTDTNGGYSFSNLAPGSYAVRFVSPSGYLSSPPNQGSNETLDSDADTAAGTTAFVSLAIEQTDTTLDAGLYRGAQVGDRVWKDLNGDGIQADGEPGMAGVKVDLLGAAGNTVLASRSTDASGLYRFTNLTPGDYRVRFYLPPGYGFTAQNTGLDAADSDADPVTGIVDLISLASGQSNLTIDAGLIDTSTPVRTGQAATIGFWNNKNGQALIKSLNGGATATSLSNWLATTFPNLYGTQAGAHNLTGMTNTQVAGFYRTLFKTRGQKLDAQVMAVALAVYVTDSDLAGSAGTAYGFAVDSQGTGGASINVGSGGAAFGVADNTSVTVFELLLSANDQAAGGVLFNGNQPSRNMANVVFTAINEQGDIR